MMMMRVMTAHVWTLVAVVCCGMQVVLSMGYEATGTSGTGGVSRQTTYRYVYPSSRVTGPNVCKSTCCPGWDRNPSTGRCTLAICNPECQNNGRCLRPNRCSCSTGYIGSQCQYQAYIQPNTGSTSHSGSRGGGSIRITSTGTVRSNPGGGYGGVSAGSRYGGVSTGSGGTATFSIRPGSTGSTSRSRTYVSRISRPRTSSSQSRTYAVTYTTGRGNVVSSNGQYVRPSSNTRHYTYPSSGTGHYTYTASNTGGTQVYPSRNTGYGTHSSSSNTGQQVHPSPNTGYGPYPSSSGSGTAVSQGNPSATAGDAGLPSSSTLARFTLRGPCFRRVTSNHCMAPLSDVTTLHDDCCATVGQGWGNGCYACPQVLGRELHCTRGFKKSPDSGKCIDVDECEAFDNICMHGACVNSPGSYRCRCDQGYMSDSSGTQCVVSVKQMCYTRVISGQCYIGSGSRMPTTQMQCCCSLGAAWGSTCARCPEQGSPEFRAMCPQGTGYHYKPSNGYNHVSAIVGPGNPQPTQNTDPCATSSRLCLNGQCINTGNGAYRCECSRGFQISSRGNQCIDINECRETRDICGGGRCLNSYGSYHCICSQGLVRRDGTCADVDECTSTSTNPCGEYACLNTRGSYHCSRSECSHGFSYDMTYQRCTDIDECASDNVCEFGRCINMEGSFRCMCPAGFVLSADETNCIDVDECAQINASSMCGSNAICVNEAGSYRCLCPGEEVYDIETGTCQTPTAPSPPQELEVERKDCYGSISDLNFCSNLLGSNVTQAQCCCTVGAGWGDDCDLTVCPSPGSATYNDTCPVGPGKHVIMQKRPSDAAILPAYPDAAAHAATGQEATISGINECEIFPDLCGGASCVDREILYDCECPEGHSFDERQKDCTVIDHCLLPAVCGNGSCISTLSGPECSCPLGYRFSDASRTCEVQDYCLVYNGVCGNGTCMNRPTGYDCQCPDGHQYNSQSTSCEVSNYCIALSGICGNGTCMPTLSGYTCRCPTGFHYEADERVCKDTDLCNAYSHLCGNGTCVDLGQNIICICPEGFEFTEARLCADVDECSFSQSPCGREATCINTDGSHRCSCPAGYEFNATHRTCDDINECRISPGLCGNATCVNAEGSFSCQCDFGYVYTESGNKCVDINECAEYTRICSNGTCMNTLGSYRCLCPRGFEYVGGNGKGCMDINECASGSGICGDGSCVNREGGFLCQCPPGSLFNEPERRCVAQQPPPPPSDFEGHTTSRNPDTLEESTCLALCGNATCAVDTRGPTCTCDQGYEFNTEMKACVDIEECTRDAAICGTATCENRLGGYACLCTPGFIFKKKKRRCVDLNECKRYPTLCNNGRCVNQKGSFACVCPPGQQFSYSSKRCLVVSAMDACSRNPGICGNGTCSLSGRSIQCLCPPGFDYDIDVKLCKAISECDLPNQCGEGAHCEDTGSGYRCVCPHGFIYNYKSNSCTEIPGPPLSVTNNAGQGSGGGLSMTVPSKRGPSACDSNPCHNGVCVSTPGGFECQCLEGYQLVDAVTCEDINECESPDSHNMCMFGQCLNEPPGSYTCECSSPLTLDSTGRRCIELIGPVISEEGSEGRAHEEPLGPCWAQPGPNDQDICSNIISDTSSYQQCCCSVGASWGTDCYACPLRDSEEYRMLCVPLSFGNRDIDSESDIQVADQPVPGAPQS